jgi:hypothetical protein
VIQKKVCMVRYATGKTSLVRKFVQQVLEVPLHRGVKIDRKPVQVRVRTSALLWDLEGRVSVQDIGPYLRGAAA